MKVETKKVMKKARKKLFIKLGLLLVVVVTGVALAQSSSAASAKLLKIKNWKNKDGVPVYFIQENILPIINIRAIFTAGSAYDSNNYGLAAITSSMFAEGNKTQTADDIAESIASVGANVSYYVDRNMAYLGLSAMTTPKYFTTAMDTYLKMLSTPTFPAKEFDRVKKQTLQSILASEQNPRAIANKAFYKAIYGSGPYGHPVTGTKDSVTALTQKNAQNFYSQYYNKNNMIITIVGDASNAKAHELANTLSSNLAKGKPAQKFPLAKPIAMKNLHINFDSSQTSVRIGQLGIDYHNPEYFPLYLGAKILGDGSFGSLLMKQLREKKGYVYGAVGNFYRSPDRGVFAIKFGSKNKVTPAAIKLAKETLNKYLVTGPTKDSLNLFKKNVTLGLPSRVDSNAKKMAALTQIAFNKLPINYMDTFAKNINAVTKQQIIKSMNKILDPKKMVMVTVGPSKK